MSQIELPAQGWKPRHYQGGFWRYMLTKPAIPGSYGARAVLAWHRRAGKDITCINWCAYASMMRVGLYWLVFPFLNQGRRIAWLGIDGQGHKFIDAWPEELIESRSNAEMRLHLKNGSVIQIMGADDPNKAVGANPIGVVFSEYSLCDPTVWRLINPILAENGGWAVFNGTPRGENHFFDLLNQAKADKAWYASHLTAKDTKAITPDALRRARDEMRNEALFQQEFMSSFASPVEGAYYDQQMRWLSKNHRLQAQLPVEPALPVHTAWDLGVGDATAIWLFQTHYQEVRIVGYYENSGEGLPHYTRWLKQWADDKMIDFGTHYAPHDIKVKEFTSGKSRLESARELGFRFKVVEKHSLEDGIDNVRKFLHRCWFDRTACSQGINALKGYHKEYDPLKRTYKSQPVHNWASHGADAFRYLAWGIQDNTQGRATATTKNISYDTDYALLG